MLQNVEHTHHIMIFAAKIWGQNMIFKVDVVILAQPFLWDFNNGPPKSTR